MLNILSFFDGIKLITKNIAAKERLGNTQFNLVSVGDWSV